MANVGAIRFLYAAAMHEAVASGNLGEMKNKLKEAEKHQDEYGNVRGALAVLKAEIAKLEK